MSANIEASLRLEIAQYQQSMAKARGEISKLKEHAKTESAGLGKNLFGGLRSELGSLLPALGASAIIGGVRSVLNEMDDLADTALRLNESTETLQRVEYASKILAGVDLSGITTNFLKLEKALGDVENKAAGDALAHYGVSAESLARLPLDQKMIVLAEAFQKARADGTGYNDLLSLLGKSAGDLIPMLEQSGQTLRDTFADAPVILDGTVQRMAAMNDQVDAFIAKQKSGVSDFLGQGLMMVDEILDPNKTLGQNTRDAAAGADKAVVDQQAKRDAAAAKIAEATAAAAAAAAQKEQIKTQQELNKLSDAEAGLTEKRFQDYLSILPPNLKLIELKREQLRLEAEREIQGPGMEADRIKNAEKLLSLSSQQRTAQKEQADEDKKAADDAKKAADEQAGKDKALGGFNDEMDLINAKLAGDKKLTEELERRASIQKIVNSLVDEAGLSEADALAKATARVDAEDKLQKKLSNSRYNADGKREDGRSQIKGYSADKQGDRGDARSRAEQRVADARDRLDARTKLFSPGLDDQTRKNAEAGAGGVAVAAGKTAAAAATPAANPSEQAAQIVSQILPQILSALTGS
jgi:hypothetical protein